MIVVMSRIRVVRGNADELATQYRNRLRLADDHPGCLGIEILRNLDDPAEFVVYSRWRRLQDYQGYRSSAAYREAHRRISEIPGGVLIDRETRIVERFECLS